MTSADGSTRVQGAESNNPVTLFDRGDFPDVGASRLLLRQDRVMNDDWLERWRFVRGMTVDFVREASDECLDFRPAAKFATVREQAAHLSEVQGIYQLALRGEEADWLRKPEFGPPTQTRAAILETLSLRDGELDDLLESLEPRATEHRVPWYGSDLTIAAFGCVFIQHESIHHGQWAAHAALGGYPTPSSWVLNWGL